MLVAAGDCLPAYLQSGDNGGLVKSVTFGTSDIGAKNGVLICNLETTVVKTCVIISSRCTLMTKASKFRASSKTGTWKHDSCRHWKRQKKNERRKRSHKQKEQRYENRATSSKSRITTSAKLCTFTVLASSSARSFATWKSLQTRRGTSVGLS